MTPPPNVKIHICFLFFRMNPSLRFWGADKFFGATQNKKKMIFSKNLNSVFCPNIWGGQGSGLRVCDSWCNLLNPLPTLAPCETPWKKIGKGIIHPEIQRKKCWGKVLILGWQTVM